MRKKTKEKINNYLYMIKKKQKMEKEIGYICDSCFTRTLKIIKAIEEKK